MTQSSHQYPVLLYSERYDEAEIPSIQIGLDLHSHTYYNNREVRTNNKIINNFQVNMPQFTV